MIIGIGKYYLYRHIRIDKNEPFYIGIGTKRRSKEIYGYRSEYSRAYSKHDRNIFWKRVVKKAGYRVEILLESDDYDFILQKEREFIGLYGRRNIKTGTLTNLTDGGEGCTGMIIPFKQQTIIQMSLDGEFMREWSSISLAAKELNVERGDIYNCCKDIDSRQTSYGFRWKFKDISREDLWIDIIKKRNRYRNRRVILILEAIEKLLS